jgi:AhpD family alkylhydroperoxidase
MAAFTKRTYKSFAQFWDDLLFLLKNRSAVKAAMGGKTLSPAFRERILMAVTSVNQCRYCSYVHTRSALKEGVSREELDGFLMGVFDGVPEKERAALLYAQHWVDMKGQPDPETEVKLKEAYPPETVAAIVAAIRMINLNNLCGNTLDLLLHTLSFGKLGGAKK